MLVYNYSKDTGEYFGAKEARSDPKNPGRFLIPALATTIQPPKVTGNYVAVFQEDKWAIVANKRDTAWYRPDGSMYTITTLGQEPAIGDAPYVSPPTPFHKWNGSAFVFDRESWLNLQVRPMRNNLLNVVDTVYCNADVWSTMFPEEQASWRAYKENLRTLPDTVDPANAQYPDSSITNAKFIGYVSNLPSLDPNTWRPLNL